MRGDNRDDDYPRQYAIDWKGKKAKMKIDQVKAGEVYWTRVSGAKVQVKLIRIVAEERRGRISRKCMVARVDNGAVLPKTRAASALHETPNFLE